MRHNATICLGFLMLSGGCAAPAAPFAAKSARIAATPTPSRAPESSLSADKTLTEAEELSRSQLGASRAGQFEVDRQVVELRRAILLYQQFLDLADGRPELQPAVKKSQQAIADLQATLAFLLQGGEPGAQPSPPE